MSMTTRFGSGAQVELVPFLMNCFSPERMNLFTGFFKPVAAVKVGRRGELLDRPQEYLPVPLLPAKSECFPQKPSPQSAAPQLRIDEKPA